MSNLYILKTDASKLVNTEGIWNHLYLNDPWSIGYISNLIETESFQSKSYWEQFYFNSGASRNRIVADLSVDKQQLLNDELYLFQNPETMMTLPEKFKAVNYEHGRTRSQLNKKAELLFQICSQHHIEINEQECIDVVYFRVIGQPWNNTINNKCQVVEYLNNLFSNEISIEKTDFDSEKLFAVDYELKRENELMCAIQIKPTSMLNSLSEITKQAISVYQKKQAQYKVRFKKEVFVIAYEEDRFSDNKVIAQIEACINSTLQTI